MDPISFIASLATLLESASVVCKAAIKFHRDLRDAPGELDWISTRILLTRSQLTLLLKIYEKQCTLGNNDDQALSAEDLAPLRTSLALAKEYCEDLEQAAQSRPDGSKRIEALKWLLRNKRPIVKLVGHLDDAENALRTLLLALSVTLSLGAHQTALDISSKQDTLLERIVAPPRHSDAGLQFFPTSSSHSNACATRPRIWRSSPLAEGQLSQNISSSLAIKTYWSQLCTTYSISCLLRPPFNFAKFVISLQASLQFSGGWPALVHSISVKNIVPRDSTFMLACEAGDVDFVKKLMVAGRGRATDVDECGKPALHKAIQSNSYNLVRLLLGNGAAANNLEEIRQESALGIACRNGFIDIGRLLLAKGACVQHIDASGCSALVNLWQKRDIPCSRIDFTKAMLAVSTLPVNPSDGEFIDPLCCAAMTGSSEDIDFLVSLGADLKKKDKNGDYLIKYCLLGCNPSTFDRIESSIPQGWVNQTNSLGRTPLQMVLQFPGHQVTKIVQRLLKAGADVHIRDKENNLPEHIARLTDQRTRGCPIRSIGSCRNFESYLEALRYCEYEPEVDCDGDLFWPSYDASDAN